MSINLKTPLTYYGGKQKLVTKILPLIPEHITYCEPFIGGGALFFAKQQSNIEVINDTNKSLMAFYRVLQNNYVDLEKQIRITLHSREAHRQAGVMYENPDLFTELQRAWAIWVLSSQSFSAQLDNSWGYDKTKNTTTRKINFAKERFTEDMAIRLQNVQLECADALYIIKSRDTEQAFFYLDPPYFNSNCGHYDGYTQNDFEELLKAAVNMKGKFILSSYPSELLSKYAALNGWYQIEFKQQISVNKGSGRIKTEVLTANFPIGLD